MRVASLLALVVLASAAPSQALAQIDRLHGAMRSDANGRYRYETIRPKGYGNAPAHVHYVVTAPGYKPRMFELWFEDQHAGFKDGVGVRQA